MQKKIYSFCRNSGSSSVLSASTSRAQSPMAFQFASVLQFSHCCCCCSWFFCLPASEAINFSDCCCSWCFGSKFSWLVCCCLVCYQPDAFSVRTAAAAAASVSVYRLSIVCKHWQTSRVVLSQDRKEASLHLHLCLICSPFPKRHFFLFVLSVSYSFQILLVFVFVCIFSWLKQRAWLNRCN